MSKRFVLLALVAFALTGCATGRPSLVGDVVRLPFGIVGGVTEVLIGTNIFPSEAQNKIAEYCGARYRGRDFATCRNGAYGSFNDRRRGSGGYGYDSYSRNSSGLAAGRMEHDRRVWEDGENFGRSLGNSGY